MIWEVLIDTSCSRSVLYVYALSQEVICEIGHMYVQQNNSGRDLGTGVNKTEITFENTCLFIQDIRLQVITVQTIYMRI